MTEGPTIPTVSWALIYNSASGQAGHVIPFFLYFRIWISLRQRNDGLIHMTKPIRRAPVTLLEIHVLVDGAGGKPLHCMGDVMYLLPFTAALCNKTVCLS